VAYRCGAVGVGCGRRRALRTSTLTTQDACRTSEGHSLLPLDLTRRSVTRSGDRRFEKRGVVWRAPVVANLDA
jgi:hypothetical protein